MSDVTYKIRVNRPCRLFIDEEEIVIIDEAVLTKISLPEGEYLRKVVAIDNDSIYDESVLTLCGTSKMEVITLDTTGLEESKHMAFPKDGLWIGECFYKANENGKGLSLLCSEKDCTEVVIPSRFIHANYLYEVTSIEKNAFDWQTSLHSIVIPKSVTYIGEYAFHHCISLTSISIPNSVTNIANCAFLGCSFLSSVIIHNGFNFRR